MSKKKKQELEEKLEEKEEELTEEEKKELQSYIREHEELHDKSSKMNSLNLFDLLDLFTTPVESETIVYEGIEDDGSIEIRKVYREKN